MTIEKIKDYVSHWNSIEMGEKPSNDPEFIDLFTEFARNAEGDQWEFTGENGYCGSTATLYQFSPNLPVRGVDFEFAYGPDYVKVFTAFHSGFWVPEYINLKGDDAKELLAILRLKVLEWAGFSV